MEDEQVNIFETSDVEAFTDDVDELIERMSSLTLSQPKTRRHSSKSYMSDARLTRFRINEDDYEDR